VEKKSGKEKW